MRRAIMTLAAAAAVLAPAASASAETTDGRSCTRPLGTSQCLENVICGAAARALEPAAEYGIDPTVNCVT